MLLSLFSIFGWTLTQLDVNNAFLHGDLPEKVYMELPSKYHHERASLPKYTICKLHKSIYGLNQASHQWFAKFSIVVLDFGFAQSHDNHSLFTKVDGFIALLVYIDDIIIVSNNMSHVDFLKSFMHKIEYIGLVNNA